jgi:hypothetical protein
MGKLVMLVLMLLVVGFAALVGYAYFGDYAPPQTTVTQPVTLDAD